MGRARCRRVPDWRWIVLFQLPVLGAIGGHNRRFRQASGDWFGDFLALRFLLIGIAIYAIIEGLGSTPGALIVGLLVSFAALVLELLWGAVGSK
jgi:hypothetical protein